MTDELPDYNELRSWASEQENLNVDGNATKEELEEAYREHESNTESQTGRRNGQREV